MKDVFVAGFLKKDAKLRASIWTDDGTVAPPTGGFFEGRRAIESDFQEEVASVTDTSRMAFSNFRFRFLTRDIAFVDADLTINNVLDPHGTTARELHVSVVFSAVRRGGRWFVQDERAHFVPAPSAGASNGPAMRPFVR